MSAERVFGTELQVSTEDQGLEVPTAVENPKKRGKRYMTGNDRLQSVHEGEFCKFNFVLSLLFQYTLFEFMNIPEFFCVSMY